MNVSRAAIAAVVCLAAWGQTPPAGDAKQRIRALKDLAKTGSESIPRVEPYLSDPEVEVRAEAVKVMTDIGTSRSLDPLIAATRDNDPEVQIRAVDGLVNFYLPGYAKSSGLSNSIKRVGSAIKAKFTDTGDQVIEPYIQVRPEVIDALARLIRGGANMDSRADAARAAGVLRGRAALDDLVQALRSKDDQLIYESLMAIQKIRDPAVAPRIAFLMRDLNDRVQLAAIETTGLLRNKEASADLRDVVEHARNAKARRAALSALAMLGDETNRAEFSKFFADRDDGMRAAAAEGLARLKNQGDLKMLETAFESEKKMNPRLSLAFATVMAGRNDLTEFSPLQYLVNTLNSKAYRGVAQPFLVELTRDPGVRRTIYGALKNATKDEKIYLGQVLAMSGDGETVKYLETLAADPDADVAQEGLRALKTLKTRL
jgi:HEAT repeat protein